MFMNFWYVAGTSDSIADKPVKVRMLGQNFVLFRDGAGKAHCLSNVCTHRGGSLAHGRVVGDTVACPYHGWQFNGGGTCVKIPSLGRDAKIPVRTRIDAYPVEERYGLVFAFLGDLPEEERPPIQHIPEWGQAGWRATSQSRTRKVNFQRAVENGLDPAHNAFVHDTHIAAADTDEWAKVGSLDVRETPWGVGFWNKVLAPPLAEGRMRQASGRTEAAMIDTGTGHHGANSVWTSIHPTPAVFIHQYSWQTPVDEGETTAYLVTMRNFLLEPEHNARIIERNFYVAHQDDVVLAEIEPVLTPEDNTHENFTPADGPIARYREFCKAWEAKGWRIDTARVKADAGRVAYAVPSPGRRAAKGWAIDPIPVTRPATTARAAAE
jgi:phenylpropionate dioxygenase-like ring-hydroxylating dioxygenase large terminal subunit